MRLFSNGSQMRPKCITNKSGTQDAVEFISDVLTTF